MVYAINDDIKLNTVFSQFISNTNSIEILVRKDLISWLIKDVYVKLWDMI